MKIPAPVQHVQRLARRQVEMQRLARARVAGAGKRTYRGVDDAGRAVPGGGGEVAAELVRQDGARVQQLGQLAAPRRRVDEARGRRLDLLGALPGRRTRLDSPAVPHEQKRSDEELGGVC
jgi:hypothetical protein